MEMNGDEFVRKVLSGERDFRQIQLEKGYELPVQELNAYLEKQDLMSNPLDLSYSKIGYARARNLYMPYLQAPGAEIWSCDFSGADFRESYFEGSDLWNSDFSKANLRDSNLSNSNLRYARFAGSDLMDSRIISSTLWETNMRRAKLFMAVLRNSNLENSDFSEADLSYVRMEGADVFYTDFTGACLEGVDFRSLINPQYALPRKTVLGKKLRKQAYGTDTLFRRSMTIEDSTVDFSITNENLDSINLGLDASREDYILSICGSGDQAFALIEKAGNVLAIDMNPNQVEYARRRAELLMQKRYVEFLELPNDIEYDDTRYLNRNAYFSQPGRLDNIRSRLRNLRFQVASLNEYMGYSNFKKVYLSNALTFMDAKTNNTEKEMLLSKLVVDLPLGALVYVTSTQGMPEHIDSNENIIFEEEKNLTKAAREKETTWTSHGPVVYRKIGKPSKTDFEKADKYRIGTEIQGRQFGIDFKGPIGWTYDPDCLVNTMCILSGQSLL